MPTEMRPAYGGWIPLLSSTRSKQAHTTHQHPIEGRIYYPFHPQCGETVLIARQYAVDIQSGFILKMSISAATDRTFNLTPRALAFAKIRASHSSLSVRECAELAGYAKAGAAVRGFELLRDDRVIRAIRAIRAILHYSALAFARAAGELSERMEASCKPRPSHCICGAGDPASFSAGRWSTFDRRAIDNLRGETKALAERLTKIEKLSEVTLYCAL
jgi:hypothetical protein